MSQFERIADLVARRNALAAESVSVAGVPIDIERFGEELAALVFGVRVAPAAERRGCYGRFMHPPLCGKSVGVRWYARPEGRIDIRPDDLPDFYLVFVGPKEHPRSLPRPAWPWTIQYAYLFDAPKLVATLRARGIRIGTSVSVRQELWEAAEIHPAERPDFLLLNREQRRLLRRLWPV